MDGIYTPVVCIQLSQTTLNCSDGQQWSQAVILSTADGTFWLYLCLSIFLVLFAGLMSGLTLGLLSMDLTTLSIILRGGDESKKKYAQTIIRLVQRHHQLLVTLLLSNAAAMETLPLFLDQISTPLIAILVSVTAVLLFGEIIPQAVCSRYGLAIGANLSWLVWILVIITWPLNYPLGKLLDFLLGAEHGTFYHRDELKELVDLHAKEQVKNQDGLSVDEVTIIKGALDMTMMRVQDLMIPIERVFMVDETSELNHEILAEMAKRGVSRVPVYKNSRENITGIVIVKSLAGVAIGTPIQSIRLDRVVRVPAELGLYDLLNIFQTGAGHMAIVYATMPEDQIVTDEQWLSRSTSIVPRLEPTSGDAIPSVSISMPKADGSGLSGAIGICTMRDVLQTLLKEEIRDEEDFSRMEALLQKQTTIKPPRLRILSASTGVGASPVTPTFMSKTARPSPDDVRRATLQLAQNQIKTKTMLLDEMPKNQTTKKSHTLLSDEQTESSLSSPTLTQPDSSGF